LLAATLKVSDNLIVSEIDDLSVEHGFLGNKSVFELNQGSHTIILRYKDVFENLDFAEDRVVESKEFVVKFTLNEEQQLELSTITIKNLARAQSFSRAPKLILKNERNELLHVELQKVSDYKLAKQVDIAVSTFASKQTIQKPKDSALALSTTVKAPLASKVSQLKTSNTLIQVNALAMLKYWWQNASNEEKKHFKQYINQ